jgi:hypothetical protein
MGHINPATDVDYIKFESVANATFNLACSSIRAGAGLIGTTYSLRDAGDVELQKDVETADKDVLWSDSPDANATMPAVKLATAGAYYLKVSATGQDPEVTGNYYICGLHMTAP